MKLYIGLSSIILSVLVSCSSQSELMQIEQAAPEACTTKVAELNGSYTGKCLMVLPINKEEPQAKIKHISANLTIDSPMEKENL